MLEMLTRHAEQFWLRQKLRGGTWHWTLLCCGVDDLVFRRRVHRRQIGTWNAFRARTTLAAITHSGAWSFTKPMACMNA